jgi:hypothetical protein
MRPTSDPSSCRNWARSRLRPVGRRVAVLFTKAYGRVLTPTLTALDPELPESVAGRNNLARAWRHFERALEEHFTTSVIAA